MIWLHKKENLDKILFDRQAFNCQRKKGKAMLYFYIRFFQVQCSVTVSAAMFGQQTEPKYSDDFYAGVKVNQCTVQIGKRKHSNKVKDPNNISF